MSNKKLKILLASPRGFCAGVERAIEIVKKSVAKYGPPVYVRHEIVHNKYVVDSLKNIGAIFVEELDEIEDKSRPVIFSAHGVPKIVPAEAINYKMEYIDATCPLVSKVHREAENLHKANYHILLIGHLNHPEVIGTMGQLPNGSIDLIQTVKDVEEYKNNNEKKIAYITQTTLSVDDTKNIVGALKMKFPDIREPVKEDICYATTNRQAAVKKIAKDCDMFFIIGSKNSSNSLRLVEVAEKAGCKYSELIHSESKIPIDKIKKCSTIGISSGASAPEILVKEFINQIKNKFPDIKEPSKEDICYATTNRQAAVKKIAKDCDMFFIIGSKNSSNSLRLVEVAEKAGCKYSELIHSESKVPLNKIKKCSTIGISSGASAPEILVKNFIDQIKKKNNVHITEIEIVKENIVFKVPGKLN